MLGLMLVGTLINVVQTGMVWASRRQFFDFGRVNPVSGLKRLFSVRGLFELFKSLLKLLIIGWVAYSFLRDNTNHILTLAEMDFRSGVETYMQMVVDLIWRVAGIYLILAVADYLYQRWEYMRNMRMSRQEILDEYKQTEGDPLLRGRIREQQRRIARMRMMSQVPKADVIITNPTHYAIAIKYDAKKMDAPVVLAKGAMLVAHRIVDIARSNHIPVVQNKPLARAIFKLVEVDNEIPPELYTAMAEVLAYVYRMKKKGLDPSTVPVEA
jgi:flagellar biosynthetic protein FlhB